MLSILPRGCRLSLAHAPRLLVRALTTASPGAVAATGKDRQYLEAVKGQKSLYATIDVLGHAFTVTQSDIVYTPRLKNTEVGDTLRMNAVKELGGSEYAIRGSPHIRDDWATVECTVIEHPLSEKRYTEKFKRRKNYHRKIGHRERYTVLRCTKVAVNI